MKSVEEIEKDLWGRIEIATKERNSKNIARLNSMASRVEVIKEELQKIEQVILSDFVNNPEQGTNYVEYFTTLERSC